MALPTANKKEGKYKIGWGKAMPGGMFKRRKRGCPAAGRIYNDHEA
jgi:hypothetical protein